MILAWELVGVAGQLMLGMGVVGGSVGGENMLAWEFWKSGVK